MQNKPTTTLRAFEVHKEEIKDALKEDGPRTVLLKQGKQGLILEVSCFSLCRSRRS